MKFHPNVRRWTILAKSRPTYVCLLYSHECHRQRTPRSHCVLISLLIKEVRSCVTAVAIRQVRCSQVCCSGSLGILFNETCFHPLCRFNNDAFATILERNLGRLHNVNLRGCTGVTDRGMIKFGQIRCTTLKELVLDGCSSVSNLGVSHSHLTPTCREQRPEHGSEGPINCSLCSQRFVRKFTVCL